MSQHPRERRRRIMIALDDLGAVGRFFFSLNDGRKKFTSSRPIG
jgi:hypothetical protein